MSPSQNDWRNRALCAKAPYLAARAFGDDLDEDEPYSTLDAMEFARDTCLSCPVMTQCREWVDKNPQTHGVLGGLTAFERNGAPEEDSGQITGAR